jgi:protein-tyrosine phosphatase
MRLHAILPDRLYQSAYTARASLAECRELVNAHQLDVIVNTWSRADHRLDDLVQYIHLPLPDGQVTPAVIQKVESLSSEIVFLLQSNKRVLVHCRGGRNRSGLITGLVLKKLLGVSGATAVELVQRARPRALANMHFVRYLCETP